MNFINLAINNLMKPIRGYQVEITMLRISHDTYSEDLRHTEITQVLELVLQVLLLHLA